jgi:hypothetical protein
MYVLAGDELLKYGVVTLGEIQDELKLEPLGKGLFLSKTAVAKNNVPRPPRRTLGFYCKSDHPNDWIVVYIHDFGSQRDTDHPWPYSIVSSIDVAAGSFKASVDEASRRLLKKWVTKEGGQAIAVYLDRNALLQGLPNAAKVSASIGLPHSHGFSAGGEFDARSLSNLLALVSKNCAY